MTIEEKFIILLFSAFSFFFLDLLQVGRDKKRKILRVYLAVDKISMHKRSKNKEKREVFLIVVESCVSGTIKRQI